MKVSSTQANLTFAGAGVALVVYAVIVRALLAVSSDLWIDEAFSFLYGFESLPVLIKTIQKEAHPPLYYVLIRAAFGIWPASALVLRGLSIVMAVGLIASILIGPVGELSRPARVSAAALLSTHPFAVYYGAEGRPYATQWLLAFWIVQCLLRGRTCRWSVVAAAVFQLAALYLHNFGALLLPLWGLALMAPELRSRGRRDLALGLAVVLAGWAPWVLVVVPGQVRVLAAEGGFISTNWQSLGPSGELAATTAALFNVPPFPAYLRSLAGVPAHMGAWAAALVAAGLVAAALVDGWRRRSFAVLVHVAAVVVLIAAPFVATFVSPMYLAGRYEMTALVPLALLVAAGADVVATRLAPVLHLEASLAVTGLGALVVLSAGVSTQAMVDEEPYHHYRPIAAAVIAGVDPEAPVVVFGLDYGPMKAALIASGGDGKRVRAFPVDIEAHPGNWDSESKQAHVADEARALVLEHGPRMVLVLPNEVTSGGRQQALDALLGTLSAAHLTTEPVAASSRVTALRLRAGSESTSRE